MKTINLEKINSFVAISDVHLKENHSLNYLKLLKILEDTDFSNYEYLFFLGDIFEFFSANSKYYLNKWRQLLNKLEEIQNKGCIVVFIEGNHDYGFEHFMSSKLRKSIKIAGDAYFKAQHPLLGNILFLHGDLITDDVKYVKTRTLYKSYSFQKWASFIPGKLLDFLLIKYAKKSRKKDNYRQLNMDTFYKNLENFISNFPETNLVLMGHIHKNLDTFHKNIRLITFLPWYEKPNILFCDNSGNLVKKFF